MEIVTQLHLKAEIIGGEKVFSGREIMSLCGYDKWERFEGAIMRAYSDLDTGRADANFFFKTQKDTGGRPKKDILLTYGGLYLTLKKCDQRKTQVIELLKYLEILLAVQKNDSKKKKQGFELIKKIFTLENLFLFLGVSAIISVSWYYYYSYTKVEKVNPNYNFIEVIHSSGATSSGKYILEAEKKKEEQVVQKIEEKLEEHKQNKKIMNYIELGGFPVQEFIKGVNYRNNFTKTLSGEELVWGYFLFGNSGLYRDSCSLLSKSDCFSGTKGDLSDFAKNWKKTRNGYEVLSVKKSEMTTQKEVYCVTYKYNLKDDSEGNFITETFNFTLKDNYGFHEIEGRYCEKKEKNGKNIACPFPLKNYYCK